MKPRRDAHGPARAARAARFFLALSFACAFAQGCASEPEFRTDERVLAIKNALAASPLPFSAGLAPCRMAFDPENVNRTAKRRFCVPPDLKSLDGEIRGALAEIGAFRNAVALDAAAGGADAMLTAAWDRELDLLVEVEIEKWDTVYKGTNFWFIPNLLIWFQFWIPSWFVPDEDYALEISARVTVKSVHTGRTIMERRIEASYEESFSNAGRGLQLLGIFRSPDSLGEENWEEITASVAPGAVHDLKVRFASLIAGDFARECSGPAFDDLMRKRLALVVGVSNYNHHRLPRVFFSREDAESFGTFLTSASGGGMPPRNVKMLLGEAATGSAIGSVLDGFLLGRARSGDELLVFFAGLGAVTEEGRGEGNPPSQRMWLMPYDAAPDAIADTGVDVGRLVDRLDACPARAVVILDTSFLPTGGSRSLEIPDRSPDAPAPALKAVRTSVISAAGPGQDCGFLESHQHGIFSYFLVRGLEGKADVNDDGEITMDEAFMYAKKETEIQAFVEDGRQQMPAISGPSASGVVLKSRRPER